MDINYIIFDYSEIDKVNFDEVLETSIDSLRLSVDRTKTIIKWIGNTPSFINTITSKSVIHTNEDMLNIMETAVWKNNTTYKNYQI
jgi:hypothetical protein